MVLEVIERMFEDAIIYAIFVLVGLVALLPLEVDKKLFTVGGFGPLWPGGQHATDQLAIIAAAYVVLEGLFDVGAQLALGDGAGPSAFLALLVEELCAGGVTFLIGVGELNLYNCKQHSHILLPCEIKGDVRLGWVVYVVFVANLNKYNNKMEHSKSQKPLAYACTIFHYKGKAATGKISLQEQHKKAKRNSTGNLYELIVEQSRS